MAAFLPDLLPPVHRSPTPNHCPSWLRTCTWRLSAVPFQHASAPAAPLLCCSLYSYTLNGYWMDVGQPKDYLKGER